MPVVIAPGYAPPNAAHALYLNQMNSGNTVVGGQEPGNTKENMLDPATYNYWKSPTFGGSVITTTWPTTRNIGGVGIAAHNLGTTGGSLAIQGSTDGTSFPTIMTYSAVTNEDLLFLFEHQQLLAIRVNFIGITPQIGVIMAGPVLRFPSTPIDAYTPVQHSREYTKYFNTSLRGQYLGNRVMGGGGRMSVQFPHVSRDWADGPLMTFVDRYNRGGSFFYAGWPSGKPQDMAYAWPGGDDSMVNVEYVNGDKLATVGFDMQFYNPT